MLPNTFLLAVALIIFALGAFSRRWVAPIPYYPTFLCSGLFFFVLAFAWDGIRKGLGV